MSSFGKIHQLLLLASLLIASMSYAEDWQLYAEQDGVRIEYKHADCDLERGYDQEWILLKIINTSGRSKVVKWKSNLWYNGECKTCEVEGQEYRSTVSIDPGQTLEGTCSIYGHKSLNFVVQFIDEQYENSGEQVLTKFELDNLSITTEE